MSKFLPYIVAASLLSGCADNQSTPEKPTPQGTELTKKISEQYERILGVWNIPGVHLELPSWETVTIETHYSFISQGRGFFRLPKGVIITDGKGISYRDFDGNNVIDRARNNGETNFIPPSWDAEIGEKVLEILEKFPTSSSSQ